MMMIRRPGYALIVLAALASSCGGEGGGQTTGDTTGTDLGGASMDGTVDRPADSILDEGVSDGEDVRDVAADETDGGDTGHDDAGASAECPAPPADLPQVTLTGDGRLRSFGQIEGDGLRPREVRVYLPEDYDSQPDRRYPVLYMHDGQNLFDPREAAFGVAWEVDAAIDRLTSAGAVEPTIVVGIDNTPDRTDEYTPGGLGDAYVDFVAGRVKPLVDQHVRTLCGRANTAVAGSSLGGLISLYQALRQPDVFGRVAAVSPSLWWDDRDMITRYENYRGRLPLRLWIDGGTAEGGDPGDAGLADVIANNRALRDLLLARGMELGSELGVLEVLDAVHNEGAWQTRLDSILGFILSDEDWTETVPQTLVASPIGDAIRAQGSPGATSVIVDALWGEHRRLTLPNRDVGLGTSTPGVIAVDRDGWITAVAAGVGEVTASWSGLDGHGRLIVLAQGQSVLSFGVRVPADTPPGDTVYITGNIPELGEWDAAGLALRPVDDRLWRGEVAAASGTPIEYKVTRGTWETVEKSAQGAEIADRQGTIEDNRVLITVARWADSP